jgi:hypothetical protein
VRRFGHPTSTALLALALVASCTRGAQEAESTRDAPRAGDGPGAGAAANERLATGAFGDLGGVCRDGDASGATAPGVTDDEIRVGTVSDKGFPGAPGLNRELYDAAVAFTRWCNEHGGILGRRLVLDDLDTRLLEHDARLTEACGRLFALVGGGAAFDEDRGDIRAGCGLPNLPGYVVSARGRTAPLQVQAVPNPVHATLAGRHRRAAELRPDGIARYGVLTTDLPSVLLLREQFVQAASHLGYTVVYDARFAPQGETGWANLVRELARADVSILEFLGQPEHLTNLLRAMGTAGWHPDLILLPENFYDTAFREEAAGTGTDLMIQSTFHPFELAGENAATQDYLDLMAAHNPDGTVALLGAQGVSAWLLFARAATACGSDLTAACLIEQARAEAGWTGGGLHAPQQPGNATASPCFLVITLGDRGFRYDEAATAPTDGVYNCDHANVFRSSGHDVAEPAW